MSGSEYDDDEELGEFRPAPHPDDRLWRHPAEIAAMRAAQANVETAQIPAISVKPSRRFRRPPTGVFLVAGVVAVGAAAVTLAMVTTRASSTRPSDETIALIALDPSSESEATSAISSDGTEADNGSAAAGEAQLAQRVHHQVSGSLPRVQAATAAGMREGSGLFVTDEGHIATSARLVEHSDYVLVWTHDGGRWNASVIAADAQSDIAILAIEDGGEWNAVAFDSGADLWAGQYALAIDHAEETMAIGEVVHVDGTTVRIDQPAATPGSAIVDDTGAVIAMVIGDGTNERATPAWLLEQVTVDLITSGSTPHPWIGVVVEDIADTEAVLVDRVIAESPAHEAGLEPGDLIDSVNGDPTRNRTELLRRIQALDPGDEAVLTVSRDGDRRIIIVTIGDQPD